MSMVRGLFVCGTDTNVGKTVVTAALARALCAFVPRVYPLKPVQTGMSSPEDPTADAARHAEALAAIHGSQEITKQGTAAMPRALHSFAMPASPHLAARQEGQQLAALDMARSIQTIAASDPEAVLLLEGAGGVMTPLNSRESMLDLMVLLDLPVILVTNNRLGALNQVLINLRVLRQAGLTVAGVVFTRTNPCPEDDTQALILRDNAAFIYAHSESNVRLYELPFCSALTAPTPALREDGWRQAAHTLRPLARALVAEALQPKVEVCVETREWDTQHLWHPYTSLTSPLPVKEAVRTQGTRILLRDGSNLVDGMASWWCAIHGYSHPRLVEAAQRQVARMSHVMFGGLTHRPAVELGQRLLPLLPQGLKHIFWADSGSVAVEVALKMALQYQHNACPQAPRTRILTPLGGYHGDTLGAMSVCDPVNGMHSLFKHTLPQQLFVPRPACRLDQPFDPATLEPLEQAFAAHGHELAAAIIEPVVQGAGGMWFYHPQYLRRLHALCRQHGVLLICDEIATGFGRTGMFFASQWAGITPDILCLGKALTGGMMSLAGTICTSAVATGICARDQVFMHGPTFMGNPLACAVALASLDLLLSSHWQQNIAQLEQSLKEGLEPCRTKPGVVDVRVLGGIGVVETEQPVPVAQLQDFFVQQGVWIRPFGRLIYLMPPYTISDGAVRRLTDAIVLALREGVHLA